MIQHYLTFKRNCAEAMETYTKAFDAEITCKCTYADAPEDPNCPIAEADKGLIMHASIRVAGADIMCADTSECCGECSTGTNMYVSFGSDDAAKVQKAWDILAEGGKIYTALAPTFFAALYGALQDKFGINWMFIYEEKQ
ncbi:MAG: VOC family protein [Proteobacteria bacterium]|nr:VOC family protein [Pseudomonadota bacterium]